MAKESPVELLERNRLLDSEALWYLGEHWVAIHPIDYL